MKNIQLLIGILLVMLGMSACSKKSKQTEKNDESVIKAKVLVLATNHFIPDSSKHEAEQILEKLVTYQPDLIATEHSPYYDTLSLRKWETNYYKTIESIKDEEQLTTEVLLDSIPYYHTIADGSYSLEHLANINITSTSSWYERIICPLVNKLT